MKHENGRSLDFNRFNTGALFLVRTPDVFPPGYAEESFRDMKENLHFDFAALLETWNCDDGVLWISNDFPRSSFWKDEPRDPIEECFLAADQYGMSFLPEAGMMDRATMEAHPEGMATDYDGKTSRYGRIGLTPACPLTLDYFIAKYDAMLQRFGTHPSCNGICMPCENGIEVTYDRYTREAWKKTFGSEMPSPEELVKDRALELKLLGFIEQLFLKMYQGLARHIKQKYRLPLMHYPIDVVSNNSFFQPTYALSQGNISVMSQVEELDMLNMQLHPPLHSNPYYFKCEAEYLMANSIGKPCMADTHFYHEYGGGRLLDTTPKRVVDNILSTLTPWGISFFCYGFMREEIPLWKKELNPGAPVYRVYQEPHTQSARREKSLLAMSYVEQLRPWLEGTRHSGEVAIYYPESINYDYVLGSYSLEHAFGLHELLNAAMIPTHFIKEIPESKDVVKCLILDSVTSIPAEDLAALKKYLFAGGKVMIIGRFAPEIGEIAEIQIRESDGRYVVSDESDDYHHCLIRLPESGRHYTEEKGRPLLSYQNGEAAVTRQGNVTYIGVSDAIDWFSDYRDFRLVTWIRDYLTEEGMNSDVVYHSIYRKKEDWHQFISLDLYENPEKKVLLIRDYGVEQYDAHVEWKLPDGWHVTNAAADGKPFSFLDGKIPVFEYYTAILAEKR